ncbi:hypothetical protein DdX_03225 [Ditylenchus destructor]|uniref:Uncharacterized protein n=1 Tax=Ditylenchus destructor TaxID=166010 RepID=A0AAD4NCN4_9BILA|nr:hypothetical protein DdX_03225 [Ditylenchus destructor]
MYITGISFLGDSMTAGLRLGEKELRLSLIFLQRRVSAKFVAAASDVHFLVVFVALVLLKSVPFVSLHFSLRRIDAVYYHGNRAAATAYATSVHMGRPEGETPLGCA